MKKIFFVLFFIIINSFVFSESEALNFFKCPNCSNEKAVRILYGKPARKAMEAANRKEIYLGGCVISGDDPQYYCYDCSNKW